MPYAAEISRRNPTCFVFLVDQSGSMAEPFAGAPGKSKAQGVTDAINSLLRNLVIKTASGTGIANRFHVGVLGYRTAGGKPVVGPVLPGPLADRTLVPIGDLANAPLRLEEVRQSVVGPAGVPVEKVTRRPVWIEPVSSGQTPMCHAFEAAAAAVRGFLAEYPDCFPPTVINVTDGRASDGDPTDAAAALRGLASSDGNVLLFNVHISAKAGTALVYPAAVPDDADAFTAGLFELSSPLPPDVLANARGELPWLEPAARGFAFNADLASFVKFVDIGTRTQIGRKAGT